jgi:type IV pilus assembly protein PilW
LPRRAARGFSLVELMVAMVLGLVLTYAMINVYLSSKTAFRRQEQLNSIQQNVRIAFEYLSGDARMVGHLGCFTGRATGFTNSLPAGNIDTNYALGVEGYEFTNATAGAYTLTGDNPANVTTAASWATNAVAPGAIATIPVATVGGSASGDGLTPGSDVLVIRTVASQPVRLTGDAAAGAATLTVENSTGGKCSDGATDKVAGFCANSHGLVASCTASHVFSVASIATSTLTLSAALPSSAGSPSYAAAATEVFPMQTIVYYVKRASSGATTSLYRRIFDGNTANGLEQELIEGVENLQLRYGRDTDATPDGIVNDYVTASAVDDWSRVVAVRMSVLIRAATPVEGDVAVPLTGRVNDVTVTYPTTGQRFDRRVFTTTVAVRNRIAYF